MFEMFPTQDIVRIAAAGGGFTLEASMRPTNDLVQIAAAAASSGARLTLKGLTMRPHADLIRIAAAGKGTVQFVD